MSIRLHFRNILILLLASWLLGAGMVLPHEVDEMARKYTRQLEFDYFNWTVNTLYGKLTKGRYPEIPIADQKEMVYTYLQVVADIQNLDGQIAKAYANPTIINPERSTRGLAITLDKKQNQLNTLAPVVEAILQRQVREIISKEGIESFSFVFPPVLYHTSTMPFSLFISPRDRIELQANISLQPVLSIADRISLENEIESNLNVSALVEPVGGLGTYPTMIMLTTDLSWLLETIAHEWIHNYLVFYPLGLNYDTSNELRTMNETTANLAGREIGLEVLKVYYPERIPVNTPGIETIPFHPIPVPVFDFRKEMRITRENTDLLLSKGKVNEAEAYMEIRRHVFWNNGYLIRRINQAYFAFYGAYNDAPGGGASGADPVGPAVVAFREVSGDLAGFLHAIARMDSFKQLEDALRKKGGD